MQSSAPTKSTKAAHTPTRASNPDNQEQQHRKKPSATLERSVYIVALVSLYAIAAIIAWVLKCLATSKPIGGRSYGYYSHDPGDNEEGQEDNRQITHDSGDLMHMTESLTRMAKVIQSGVALLTVPLISAVCSQAAVVYLQRSKQSAARGPSLRQAMALADKGWTTPQLLLKLAFQRRSRKRYGSPLLWISIGVMILGLSLNFLQAALTRPYLKMAPDRMIKVDEPLADIPRRFASVENATDDGYTVTQVRSRLTAAKYTDPQMRLWSLNQPCGAVTGRDATFCRRPGRQYSLGGLGSLERPFWSQLQSGFNTGLIQQFAPWIRSESYVENITNQTFDENCRDTHGALYLRYRNSIAEIEFDFEICMPGNMTESPWKPHRSQQKFREDLLLRVSLSGSVPQQFMPGVYTYNISLRTEAGYFELPNYENTQLDLHMSGDPVGVCNTSTNCEPQDTSEAEKHPTRRRLPTPTTNSTEVTTILRENINKGPLLTITLALFGAGSFLDSYRDYSSDGVGLGQCSQVLPMTHLFRDFDAKPDGPPTDLDPCVKKTEADRTVSLRAQYIWSFFRFVERQERIVNAFNAAAFLTHDVVMMCNPSTSNWTVHYDFGRNLVLPDFDVYSGGFISAYLCVYLICLMALALYSARTPRWTTQLDSFAMMRIGASMADDLPLQLAPDVDDIKVLDDVNGCIGDGSEDDDGAGSERSLDGNIPKEPGSLAMGVTKPLRRGRKYQSYSAKKSRWHHWPKVNRGSKKESKGRRRDEGIPLQDVGVRDVPEG